MTSLEIDAFLSVYREGSITKAAESLYINPPSVPGCGPWSGSWGAAYLTGTKAAANCC